LTGTGQGVSGGGGDVLTGTGQGVSGGGGDVLTGTGQGVSGGGCVDGDGAVCVLWRGALTGTWQYVFAVGFLLHVVIYHIFT
jgi:hypothetical protein